MSKVVVPRATPGGDPAVLANAVPRRPRSVSAVVLHVVVVVDLSGVVCSRAARSWASGGRSVTFRHGSPSGERHREGTCGMRAVMTLRADEKTGCTHLVRPSHALDVAAR
ncbi:hypothetical protein PsYK624_173290 [Phanerochaete sordida]|uniref:Uncharacterized protein n=1 Tax=Phanerochaete sordida TaxID=48140 RepID=A0A9P3LQ28_9APHY|nr:hypothetical protein PsYK624_173290 [Phanerochaete sordida]